MYYESVLVYDKDGGFIGYAIKKIGIMKFESQAIWDETAEDGQMLAFTLEALNEKAVIQANMPGFDDPDVQALLNDPEYEPLKMIYEEIIDQDASLIQFKLVPEFDLTTGLETGRLTEGDEIDYEASVVKYTKEKVPARPSEAMERVSKARERIAKERIKL